MVKKKERNDLVDYFDTPLVREEAAVLMALHPQIGEIPVVSSIIFQNSRFGFATRNYRVVELGFTNIEPQTRLI